jgi:hypothetical protein
MSLDQLVHDFHARQSPPVDDKDKPCLSIATSALVSGLAAGGAWGTIQAAWDRTPRSGSQVPTLTKIKGAGMRSIVTIARSSVFFGAIAAAYKGAECYGRQSRGVDDAWNCFYGGAGAGVAVACVRMYYY